MTNIIPNFYLVEQVGGGLSSEYDLSWLYGDADGDALINMLDPDAQLSCFNLGAEPYYRFAGCDEVVLEPDPDPEAVLGGALPDVDQITGPPEDAFGCGTYPFGGAGSTYGVDVSSPTSSTVLAIWFEWLQSAWTGHEAFGDPSTPRPYENPYQVIRAGAGGAITAYFSAPWGKKFAFVDPDAEGLENTTANLDDVFKEFPTTFFWHRYVIYNQHVYLQFWHPSSGCWRPLYVYAWSVACGVGVYCFDIRDWIPVTDMPKYVPVGYFPGELPAETLSNVPVGEDVLARFFPEQWAVQGGHEGGAYIGAPGGTGGGESLTASEMEQAVYDAVGRASGSLAGATGQAVGGAVEGVLGSGDGVGAAEGVFGTGGSAEGDGGALDGIESALAVQSGDLLDRVTDYLMLAEITPDAQDAAVLEMALPKPGGGEIEFSISTIPDTSTTMGTAFDGVRVIVRMWFAYFLLLKAALALVNLYKEIT